MSYLDVLKIYLDPAAVYKMDLGVKLPIFWF
jgi:hypothetical protein